MTSTWRCVAIIFVCMTLQNSHAALDMGARVLPGGRGCSFKVWAPHGENVRVEVRKRDEGAGIAQETVELKQGDGGIWHCESATAVPGDMYRFVLESTWNDCYDTEGKTLFRRDPYARFCPVQDSDRSLREDNAATFCVVDDPESFAWKTPHAPRLLQGGLGTHSIYEMHVGSYTPEGTLRSAMQRLEHVAGLGFTCIELMPVTEFGGAWGYNPRSCMAIHSPYGTPEDMRAFVDKAHELGMAIMVDVCLNHGSARLNSLWAWDGHCPHNNGGIYFDRGGGDTPWGKKFAFDRAEVQEYLLDACRMWILEYRCDGLRMDSVHNVPDWLNNKLCRVIREEAPGVCVTGEVVPEDPRFLLNGVGFDAIWLHQPVFDLLDSGGGEHRSEHWAAQVRSMIRQRYFPDNAAATGVNPLLGSHDQGTEILQSGWWHTDKHMDWGLLGGEGAGLRKLLLGTGGCEESKQMMVLVRAVLTLRKEHPGLVTSAPNVVHQDNKNLVFGVNRGGEYLAVMNAGHGQWGDGGSNLYSVGTGETTGPRARQIFNSQAREHGGWDDSWSSKSGQYDLAVDGGKLALRLPKWSVCVFQFGQ